MILIFIALTISQSASYAIDNNYSDSYFRNPFKPQLPQRKQVSKPSPEAAKKSIKKKKTQAQKKAATSKHILKQSVEAIPQEPPLMVISGLVWNSERPQAIVNNQIIDVGDKIETIQVVAIRKEGIEIKFNGRTITIEP